MSTLPDAGARETALLPDRSFIVQAPAGSGKTGLLIRRYLTLLAYVNEPEEIVAITFTRKAAAEMRDRVLSALSGNSGDAAVDALAEQARRRDAELGWQIEDNPSRLRITTIDGFCLTLTRQMPWTSGFGAPPGIAEELAPLYTEAARQTLALIDENSSAVTSAIRLLLAHFDNNFQSVESMLADMLARRDQWADEIVGAGRGDSASLRDGLEDTLTRIVSGELKSFVDAFPAVVLNDIVECARGAGKWVLDNCKPDDKAYWIARFASLESAPGVDANSVDQWKALIQFFMTADAKSFRKPRGVNKNLGFPADKTESARKDRFKAVLEDLEQDKYVSLIQQAQAVTQLPGGVYDDAQWTLVEALTTVLPIALAQLRLAFIRNGEVDFAEIQLRATQALGDEDSPTDLALRLDYRIQHLLVDEYQDTSSGQEDLISRLVRGWAPDGSDGRTLFVVGDPMQSIYRFRKADVGLFVQATHQGIGSLPLEHLELSVNFRSEPGVVQWVNDALIHAMPAKADAVDGAVPLTPSAVAPGKTASVPDAVTVHPFHYRDRITEAQTVVGIIYDTLEETEGTIAILVRSRSHMNEITPLLRGAGIAFQGNNFEPLAEQAVVQDLLALARVLLHPADRIAWLSVLRAPWCGLELADLSALIESDRDATVLARLNLIESLNISEDGRRRLDRIIPVLNAAVQQRRRGTLRRSVERLWTALDGPACTDARGLVDAHTVLDLIEKVEVGCDVIDLSALESEVEGLYAAPDLNADRVFVMTIHQSKGLEFDTVILPGLGRAPGSGGRNLLNFAEVAVAVGEDERGDSVYDNRVLLSPPGATGADRDPLYGWLSALDKKRAELESGRLLYVACTRAERRLHLLGDARIDKDGEWSPANGTLLKLLWPVTRDAFSNLPADTGVVAVEDAPATDVLLRRLPSDWVAPPATPSIEAATEADVDQAFDAIEFSWAGENARQVGNVVHDALMKIAEDGLELWDEERIAAEQGAWKANLLRSGILETELEQALKRVGRAVQNAVSNEHGRWILDDEHTDARSEYPLTGVIDGTPRQIVIDRTFVDADNVRWIVDYKTSDHTGGGMQDFLDSERERYSPQLERYARVISSREDREVRVALYFPLLGELIAWTPSGD